MKYTDPVQGASLFCVQHALSLVATLFAYKSTLQIQTHMPPLAVAMQLRLVSSLYLSFLGQTGHLGEYSRVAYEFQHAKCITFCIRA